MEDTILVYITESDKDRKQIKSVKEYSARDLISRINAILKEEIPNHESKVRLLTEAYSVGVQGDCGTYAPPAEIEVNYWNPDHLEKISTRITNEVSAVNKVVYVLAKK